MFFGKIYTKLDDSFKQLEYLQLLTARQHGINVDLICGIDSSIGSLKNDFVSLQQEVITLHKVINDLKDTLAPK